MHLFALSLVVLVGFENVAATRRKPSLRQIRDGDYDGDDYVECSCRAQSSGIVSSAVKLIERGGTCPHCDGDGVARPSILGTTQDLTTAATDCGLGCIPIVGGCFDIAGGLHNTIEPWVDCCKGERSPWDATKRCGEGLVDIGVGALSVATLGVVGAAKNGYKAGSITKKALKAAKSTGRVLKHVSTGLTAAKGIAKAVEKGGAGGAADGACAVIGGAMGHIGHLKPGKGAGKVLKTMNQGHYNQAIQAGGKTLARAAITQDGAGCAQEAILGAAAYGMSAHRDSSKKALKGKTVDVPEGTDIGMIMEISRDFCKEEQLDKAYKVAETTRKISSESYKSLNKNGQRLWKAEGGDDN